VNRRGFLGWLGKCLAVGAALGVAPGLIQKAEKAIAAWTYKWVQVGGPAWDAPGPVPDGATFAFELQITPGDGPVPKWYAVLEDLDKRAKIISKSQVTLAS